MATKLTGVKQVARPHVRLREIYQKILRLMQKLPLDAAYRKNTETIVSCRLSIVSQTEDPQEIEKNISCGSIDMLISQALAEYELCQRMIVWKCWEPLKDWPPSGQWRWPPVLG